VSHRLKIPTSSTKRNINKGEAKDRKQEEEEKKTKEK